MGHRILSHLRRNLVAYVALFAALGWTGAYAAQKVGKNDVRSKQIKDGQVKSRDLANAAVTAPKLAPGVVGDPVIADGSVATAKLADGSVGGADVTDGGITGADTDESTLTGITAATINGLEVKKINLQAAGGASEATVLRFGDTFRIVARCTTGGDFLDVTAFTGVDNAAITQTATSLNGANDRDGVRHIAANSDLDFDTTETYKLDDFVDFSNGSAQTTVHFVTRAGFISTTHLQMAFVGGATGACAVTGVSIGG